MNSLVVLLSVVALAAASPSGLLKYAAPVIAAPAGPAIVSPVTSYAALPYPAPGVYSAPLAAAPGVYSFPYAAPTFLKTAALAPAAITEAHLIKKRSAPIVAAATPLVSTYSAVPALSTYAATSYAYSAPGVYSAPLAAAPGVYSFPYGAPTFLKTAALAPAAITEAHLIKKRSAPIIAAGAPFVSTYSAAPVVSTYSAAHYPYSSVYSSPLITAPVVTKAYGVGVL